MPSSGREHTIENETIGGKLPPVHDALYAYALFDKKASTGSVMHACPAAQTRLIIPRPLLSHGPLGESQGGQFPVRGGHVGPQSTTLTTKPLGPLGYL